MTWNYNSKYPIISNYWDIDLIFRNKNSISFSFICTSSVFNCNINKLEKDLYQVLINSYEHFVCHWKENILNWIKRYMKKNGFKNKENLNLSTHSFTLEKTYDDITTMNTGDEVLLETSKEYKKRTGVNWKERLFFLSKEWSFCYFTRSSSKEYHQLVKDKAVNYNTPLVILIPQDDILTSEIIEVWNIIEDLWLWIRPVGDVKRVLNKINRTWQPLTDWMIEELEKANTIRKQNHALLQLFVSLFKFTSKEEDYHTFMKELQFSLFLFAELRWEDIRSITTNNWSFLYDDLISSWVIKR